MLESISIVVPVRDGERFLETAIRSLLDQTRPASQVVVVDDGSTDDSATVAAGVDSARVDVVRLPPSGPAAARNAGVAAATGALVGFLDADDYALPGRLATQAALLEADPATDIVSGLAANVLEFSPGIPDRARAGAPVRSFAPGTLLMRRGALDRVGPFDESLRTVGDTVDWIARARRAELTWAEHDDLVLLRRAHDANLSSSTAAETGYLQLARAAILRHREATP